MQGSLSFVSRDSVVVSGRRGRVPVPHLAGGPAGRAAGRRVVAEPTATWAGVERRLGRGVVLVAAQRLAGILGLDPPEIGRVPSHGVAVTGSVLEKTLLQIGGGNLGDRRFTHWQGGKNPSLWRWRFGRSSVSIRRFREAPERS